MDKLFLYNKVSKISRTKRLPRSAKKVNINRVLEGIDYARGKSAKILSNTKNSQLYTYDEDFISGIDSALGNNLKCFG